jgi:hypothetical protein
VITVEVYNEDLSKVCLGSVKITLPKDAKKAFELDEWYVLSIDILLYECYLD